VVGVSVGAEEREALVKAAILAPSMHNTQPWLFRFRGHEVEVYRDPKRELRAEDPHGRLTMIGVGAAIFNLRVAAAELGYETSTHLVPDAAPTVPVREESWGLPTLAARIVLSREKASSDLGTSRELAALYRFLPRRRTNRNPFFDRPIPPQVKEELQRVAMEEGASLEWVEDETRIRWLHELALDAEISEADEPERLVERQMWVGGERDDSGIPARSLGPRPADPSAAVRDLAVDPSDRLREAAEFERQPTLAVLSTQGDEPQDWLRAGQALQRVWLVATSHEVAMSLVNQPVEHADLRWLVRDPLAGWSEPQVVLRLGYGPEVPPTPRRPVAEFILPDATVDEARITESGDERED
jgi:hypothetical protein